jgi:hypothetical protein
MRNLKPCCSGKSSDLNVFHSLQLWDRFNPNYDEDDESNQPDYDDVVHETGLQSAYEIAYIL